MFFTTNIMHMADGQLSNNSSMATCVSRVTQHEAPQKFLETMMTMMMMMTMMTVITMMNEA